MSFFRNFQYRRNMYRGGANAITTFSTDRVVFEGFSLSDGQTMIMTDLLDSGPTTDLVTGSVPRGDGKYLTGRYLRERIIEASGIVRKSTAAELDAYLDTIKRNLHIQEGELDITDAAGTAKRFIATLDNFEELFADRQRYHITYCPFKARFRCLTPFGKARLYTASDEALTLSPTTHTVSNTGTYRASAVVILIFSSASSVTAVSLTNSATGEQITFTGSVAAGDWLAFDGELKQVLKNGVAQDYSGAFLGFDVGPNPIVFTVTGSSFAATATLKYRRTYL